jgi:hypothetical protein
MISIIFNLSLQTHLSAFISAKNYLCTAAQTNVRTYTRSKEHKRPKLLFSTFSWPQNQKFQDLFSVSQIFTNTTHTVTLKKSWVSSTFFASGGSEFARVLYDVHIIYMYSSWCNVFFNDSSGNAHILTCRRKSVSIWRKIFPHILVSEKWSGKIMRGRSKWTKYTVLRSTFMFSVVLFSKDFVTCWTLVFF